MEPRDEDRSGGRTGREGTEGMEGTGEEDSGRFDMRIDTSSSSSENCNKNEEFRISFGTRKNVLFF